METEEAFKGLSEAAKRIGDQHAAQAGAWEAAVTAEADLLATVIGAIAPALPAICSRVEVKRQAGIGTPATWKGVRVAGSLLEGRCLYVNEHGTLVELNYMIGANENEWEAAWCPVTPRHIVTEFKVERIVDSLAAALARQAKGAAAARTEQLRLRAAQLQVVASMLRGMK